MRKSDEVNTIKSHDKQIFDSKHDEIVVWLYQKLKNPDWFNQNVFSWVKKNYSVIEMKEVIQIGKPKIEKALIKTKRNYYGTSSATIGFADIALQYRVSLLYKQKSEIDNFYVFFEVKSSVNIGETIRQINYYQDLDVEPIGRWFVCAPEFDQSSILLEQGVGFIPYKK